MQCKLLYSTHFIKQNLLNIEYIDLLILRCKKNMQQSMIDINENLSLHKNQIHKKVNIIYLRLNKYFNKRYIDYQNYMSNIIVRNFYINLRSTLSKILYYISQHRWNFTNTNYQHIEHISQMRVQHNLNKQNYKICMNYLKYLCIKIQYMQKCIDRSLALDLKNMRDIMQKNCHYKSNNKHYINNKRFHLNNIFMKYLLKLELNNYI